MILDTTVLVDLLRKDRAAAARVRALEGAGEPMRVPTPVIFELWEGVERSDKPEAALAEVTRLLDAYAVLSLEARHAMRAGRVSGSLVRRGVALDPVDVIIAGMALEEDDAVLTRNLRHFGRVPGLRTEGY